MNKPANAAQKKWMSDISDWASYHIDRLYGVEYLGKKYQLHHVLGRAAKNNKVAIGHWFILPVPFELHDVSSNHKLNVTHCKKEFVRVYGYQRYLFNEMYNSMSDQGYTMPSREVFESIVSTSA